MTQEVRAIFGPPGTGKTKTLVDYAALENKRPGGLLYLSYTRAAAQEATSRLTGAEASTIHSMAFRALRLNRASIVDRAKLKSFARVSGFPFMGTEEGSDEQQEGDEYLAVVQYGANKKLDIMEAYDDFGSPGERARFASFYEAYFNWKITYGFIDFDDMLLQFIHSKVESVPYRVVFLDEAQDCSPLQWDAFAKACAGSERVYIGGDDDQAIYEWSGADPHGMIKFTDDGKRRVLDQSFRVPRAVHERAHVLISKIDQRVDKKWNPREAEGSVIEHGDISNIDLAKFADTGGGMILVRDRFRADEVKKALNRELIPYDVLGGVSPWTSKIAQALLRGESPDIPPFWREFYQHADLKQKRNIQVSTVHQAKGREAERVILDLTMPAKALADLDKNPDAEVRVWYVAMTRAKGELWLCGDNPLI